MYVPNKHRQVLSPTLLVTDVNVSIDTWIHSNVPMYLTFQERVAPSVPPTLAIACAIVPAGIWLIVADSLHITHSDRLGKGFRQNS